MSSTRVRVFAPTKNIGAVNGYLYCIALPVLYNGKVDSAVSVSLPSFRADESKLALVEEALRAATSRIAEFQREQRQSFSSGR